MARPRLEVADVIRQYGKEFLRTHGASLTLAQKYVLKSLAACRTAALGGHLQQCDRCGHQRPAYNSCRNRHCPKCQAAARAQWTAARERELLPVPYYHVVFTLPPSLARIALQNKKVVYDLLFAASSQTLQRVAADAKHLGAKIGFLSVLHTWGQNLQHHPHVHCLVPGGGLSADEQQWIACKKDFFLPVKVLSRVFRGVLLDGLKRAYRAGRLSFHGALVHLRRTSEFARLVRPLYQQDWVVYAKPPFGSPRQVLKYLARYTHRVAISNQRLVKLEAGRVTFRLKNYAQGNQWQTMTLDAAEFLRRFLVHVLPAGLVKIRHYGLLANCHRERQLARCRALIGTSAAEPADSPTAEIPLDSICQSAGDTDHDLCCPSCGVGRMRIVERTARPTIPELLSMPWPWDTS
jgi:hypothetical protein